MASFLITGARAPVALELARNLARHQHDVYVADSLRYPLAKNSVAVKQSFYIRSPKFDYSGFVRDLQTIIRAHQIEYLLPTCEEAFYVAHAKDRLGAECQVLCPDFDLISVMHDKYRMLSLASDCGVKLPQTHLLDFTDLDSYRDKLSDYVLKRRYCRFGTDVIVDLTQKKLRRFRLGLNESIVLQKKIAGQEICSYSIACNGRLTAHASYKPQYRLHHSSSIYFKPVADRSVFEFVKKYAEKHNLTGQVAFDFIRNEDGVFLLDTNPRAASGLHLLYEHDLSACLTGQAPTMTKEFNADVKPAMVRFAMLLLMLPVYALALRLKQWRKDLMLARDVISSKDDKGFFFFQIASLLELLWLALKHKKTIKAASTHDIEWDGEDIV